MRIDRHIFGSYTGYTTLARSTGVSAADCQMLEAAAYGFGQSNDRRFLKSLSRTSAHFTRSLPGGRRGLTRVLEGERDDNDRPTLRMVTLIVAQRDWDSDLCGDVDLLLNNSRLWEWDGSTQLAVEEVPVAAASPTLPRKAVPRVLALVSELERAYAARRNVLVSEEDFTAEDLRALEMLIPPMVRPQITTAYRSLGHQLAVTVNCLASGVDTQAVTFRYDPAADVASPYTTFLSQTELSDGVLPLVQVMGYRSFGAVRQAETARPAATATMPMPPVEVIHRTPKWPLVVAAALVVVAGVGGFLGGRASVGAGSTAVGAAPPERAQELAHAQELLYRPVAAAAIPADENGKPSIPRAQVTTPESARQPDRVNPAATQPPSPAPQTQQTNRLGSPGTPATTQTTTQPAGGGAGKSGTKQGIDPFEPIRAAVAQKRRAGKLNAETLRAFIPRAIDQQVHLWEQLKGDIRAIDAKKHLLNVSRGDSDAGQGPRATNKANPNGRSSEQSSGSSPTKIGALKSVQDLRARADAFIAQDFFWLDPERETIAQAQEYLRSLEDGMHLMEEMRELHSKAQTEGLRQTQMGPAPGVVEGMVGQFEAAKAKFQTLQPIILSDDKTQEIATLLSEWDRTMQQLRSDATARSTQAGRAGK